MVNSQINIWLFVLEVEMKKEDFEVLITLDDPGEDTLEEDTFHNQQTENTGPPFPPKRRRDQKTIGVPDVER